MPPETTGYNGMVRTVELFLHRSSETHMHSFLPLLLLDEGGRNNCIQPRVDY